MNLVTGHDATVAQWIERTYGDLLGKPGYAWGIVDRGGALRGAFVVTLEHNRTAELHVYGQTSNDTVRAMFLAVFRHLGIYRLQIRTSRKNKTIRRAAPKYGFAFEGVQRHFYGPGDDALCWYMTSDKCRWLTHGFTSKISEGAGTNERRRGPGRRQQAEPAERADQR